MQKIKLYLNENITDEVSQRLRNKGYDAISSHEAGKDSEEDEEQIAYAVSKRKSYCCDKQERFHFDSQGVPSEKAATFRHHSKY